MLAIVVLLTLSPSLAAPAPKAAAAPPSIHERITAETGLTFSVLGSLLRRSIVSTDTPYGFSVDEVRAGSRGDRAGIRRGDVLLKWDGRPIRDLDTLDGWIREEMPGAEVAVVVARRKASPRLLDRKPWRTLDLTIRVGRPSLFQETGIAIDFVDSWWARRMKGDASGLRVGLVRPGSPAEKVGVRNGDVLLEWKGRPIVSFATLEEWIDEDLPGGRVEIVYARRVGGKFSLDPWDERTATLKLDP